MKKLIYKNNSFLAIVDGFEPDRLYPEPEHQIWYIPDWFTKHCFTKSEPDYSVAMKSHLDVAGIPTPPEPPEFVDPRPLPNDMASGSIKARRTQLLADTDWTAVGDVALSDEKKKAWAEYRQSLRDLPNKYASNPNDVIWPVPPGK